MNTLQLPITNFSTLLFKFRFKSFRKAIIFKKFFLLYSKILRKHHSRMKHSYNWLIYTQIWQHWIKDFFINKNINKYLYYKNFHIIECLQYDSFRFNSKQQKLTPSSQQLSCSLPHSLFFWINQIHKRNKMEFLPYLIFPNTQWNLSYSLNFKENQLIQDKSLTILTTISDVVLTTSLFSNNILYKNKNITTFDDLFNHSLQLTIEFYKIQIFIWYLKIFLNFNQC